MKNSVRVLLSLRQRLLELFMLARPSRIAALALGLFCTSAYAQKIAVPRAHDRPPGPALSPEEAIKRMTVPEGFHVEVVAAEPDILNPVAMHIDEKGRFWITESFEYPRREPGPGRDRVKVLEDTDGDGKVDKVTVFAEGLNIPSGIAVGYGGVWVANAPDLLFLQDTDGDLKADKSEVVVTGFGRTDTHELPNSFTWGPDGWLYGLNGVFNYSHIKYGEKNPNYKVDHPGWPFTCALWRVHPKTREFQVWAEGTSNPWGVAINDEGDFFLSACVIDHLWHLVETGYYVRQGGPYPAHTWPIGSIVKHKHQKAAYCGITWFDSDAWPEEYRKVLYMGNIHGGCINADVIERNGSTYAGKPHPGFPGKAGAWAADKDGTVRKEGTPEKTILKDLLTANDPWFMPVVQKTGPDGSLYILDWYDRYHCYQDANADPEGIDRAKGRLYRLVYGDAKPTKARDFTSLSSEELVGLALEGHNEYERDSARLVLAESLSAGGGDGLAALKQLRKTLSNEQAPTVQRLRALWTLASADGQLQAADLEGALEDQGTLGSWGVRLLADRRKEFPELYGALVGGFAVGGGSLKYNPVYALQLVIAFSKMDNSPKEDLPYYKTAFLLTLLNGSKNDPVIPRVIWQNLHPLMEDDRSVETFAEAAADAFEPQQAEFLSRAMNRIQNRSKFSAEQIALLVGTLSSGNEAAKNASTSLLASLAANIQTGSLDAAKRDAIKAALGPKVTEIIAAGPKNPHYLVASQLGCTWGQREGIDAVTATLESSKEDGILLDCLRAIIASGDQSALSWSQKLLDSGRPGLQEQVLFYLTRMDAPAIATLVLERYGKFEPQIQPKAIELLTQRAVWSGPLLKAIEGKQVNKDSLNLNQLRRVSSFKNDDLQASFKSLYGVIREGRNPNREQVMNQTRDFLYGTPGDPVRGQAVFKKVCAQCHKMYGEGAEVGPDITSNGRASYEQLLSNVLDPSLVIGNAYQARIVVTADGRVLTGLPVEESPERVVLKVQGGKIETIPRDQIEEFKVSEASMMPEQLEKQITPQELADLFSFIGLDKPPSDPTAKRLPGVPTGRK
jgi:putative membrane-bound dehydrogenase-like protein